MTKKTSFDETTIRRQISEIVGSYLHLPVEEIDVNLPFLDLGADSIAVVEIVRDINKTFDFQIETTDIYDYSSVFKISHFIYEKLANSQEVVIPLDSANLSAAGATPRKPQPSLPKKASPQPVILQDNTVAQINGNIKDRAGLKRMLSGLLQEKGFVTPRELTDSMKLSQLGIDFISIIEIVQRINEEFGLSIDSGDVYLDGSAGELVDLILSEREAAQNVFHHITGKGGAKEDTGDTDHVKNEHVAGRTPKNLAPIAIPSPTELKISYPEASARKIILSDLQNVTPVSRTSAQEEAAVSRETDQETSKPAEKPSIAVIGMSGRFPGARNIEEFWRNLSEGTASIGTFPTSRWLDTSGAGNEENDEHRWFGHLEDIDKFDPLFFNISPKEAEQMDPQQRLFLEETWNALEHAGYAPQDLSGTKCGVFVGVTQGDYNQLIYNTGQALTAQFMLGSSPAILSARAPYFLNLTGPSIAVDTACSSSLVAIHLACKSIRDGECEMALAGGVYLQTTPYMHEMTINAGMLSKDGRCKTFDNGADGFVLGEGVGVIVLKPLDRAIAERDTIYGVIKGSGINQDGATNGITAPSAKSQSKLEEEVYQQFNVNPDTISLVEAHGTGTKLGDPIEIKALTNTFEKWTDRKQFCAVGSVKTNIGHLLTAAGISAVIKVLLCLQHKKLVPSLNYENANDNINFFASPFFVNTVLRDWETPGIPRRAAISSFGFSGTNCHMLIEEGPGGHSKRSRLGLDRNYLAVFSAKTHNALFQRVSDLSRLVEKGGFVYTLPDLAYTLQVGRSHMKFRVAFLAQNLDELQEKMRDFLSGRSSAEVFINDGDEGPLKEEPLLKELGKYLTRELRNLGRAHEREYKEKLLALADLFCKGYEIDWKMLYPDNDMNRIPLPQYPFEREKCWVKGTSKSKNRLPTAPGIFPHPMLHSNQSTIYEQLFYTYLSGDEYYVRDHVIGGRRIFPAVAYLELMQAAGKLSFGKKAIIFENISWKNPVIADDEVTLFTSLSPEGGRFKCEIGIRTKDDEMIICCSSEAVFHDEEFPGGIPEVRDLEGIQKRCGSRLSAGECYDRFRSLGVEFGDRMKAIQELIYHETEVLATLRLPSKLKSNFQAYTLPPSLLDGGVTSSIALLSKDETVIRVPYSLGRIEVFGPFEEVCYAYVKVTGERTVGQDKIHTLCLEILAEDGRVLARLQGLISKPFPRALVNSAVETGAGQFDTVYLRECWEEKEFSDGDLKNLSGDILLFDQDEPLYHELIRNKVSVGRVALVKPGAGFSRQAKDIYELNPLSEQDYVRLLSAIRQDGGLPGKIIHRWAFGSPVQRDKGHTPPAGQSIYALFYLLKALMRAGELTRTDLLHIYPVSDEYEGVFHKAVKGFIKTVNLESTMLSCKTIAVDPSGEELSRHRDLIAHLLTGNMKNAHFKYEGGRLFSEFIAPFDLQTELNPDRGEVLKDGGVYLISGGAGALGRIFARQIIQRKKTVVILTGRSPLAEDALLEFGPVNRTGSGIVYLPCDVSQYEQVETLIKTVKNRYGRLDGIIHAAGVTKDALIVNETGDDWDKVLAPKINGAVNLDQATRDEHLDFYALFSSIAATMGNNGQAAYSYANQFLNEFAAWREKLCCAGRRHGKTLSICWPEWENGGLRVSESARNYFKEKTGAKPLDDETGWHTFLSGLNFKGSCFTLAQADPKKIESLLSTNSLAGSGEIDNGAVAGHSVISEDDKTKTENRIRLIIADQMKIAPENLHAQKELSKFGFDSITLTDLSSKLNKQFDLELTPAIFFEVSTIASLGEYLLRNNYQKVLAGINSEIKAETESKHITEPQAVVTDFKTRDIMKRGDTKEVKFAPFMGHAKEPIAIIGMHGIFPGVSDLEEFWDCLEKGRSLISEIPDERWNWKEYYGDPLKEGNKTDIVWGGFIKDPFAFDAKFFEISPREAEWMDPQQRIFLETVWKTIEDSGYCVSSFHGKKVGLFVGASTTDYNMALHDSNVEIEPYALTGNTHSIIANRISHILNLHGPSEAIDTACSSSLIAIRHAITAIHNKECEMAIAGGVNILLSPDGFIGFSKGGFLSRTGRCKTFDADADGYVRGEGAGAILLKPLHKAIKDGDHIYAVIKGTAENHGGRGASLTAPNASLQAEVIVSAIKDAGVDPETITYIEAHGTGTKLGDPTEINGLKKAFEELLEGRKDIPKPFCGIGALKTNIGHLEPAAGIAGIIKLILAFQHQKIPASINFTKLNPYIQINNSPFYIVKETQIWERKLDEHNNEVPRRAGISSFGFGGSNAHIIFEEFHQTAVSGERSVEQLFTLSARDEERLKAYAGRLYDFLVTHRPVNDMEDICYTLQTGRDAMAARLAFLVQGIDELEEKLASYLKDETPIKDVFAGVSPDNISAAGHAHINAALASKDLRSLASLWVSGYAIDWNRLYINKRPGRISLPTYPFARHHYRIPNSAGRGPAMSEILHPLVHQNLSTLNEQRFKTRLNGMEFFVRDHVVASKRVLPGVAYMELARVAGEISSDIPVRKIRDLVWVFPLTVSEGGVEYCTRIFARNENLHFEISSLSGENTVIHASGDLDPATEAHGEEKPVFLIEAVLSRLAKDPIDPVRFYEMVAESGLSYGNSFKVIAELYHLSGESLSRLEFPEEFGYGADQFYLHPAVMDGAMQTVIGLLYRQGLEENVLYLPFALDELTIFGPTKTAKYVYAVFTSPERHKAGDTKRQYDVTVLDKEGHPLVAMKGLQLRPFHRQDSVKEPQSAEKNLHYFSVAWEDTPLAVQDSPVIQGGVVLVFGDGDKNKETLVDKRRFNPETIVLARPGPEFKKVNALTYEVDPACEDHYMQLITSLQKDDRVPSYIIHFNSGIHPADAGEKLENHIFSSVLSMAYLVKSIIKAAANNQVRVLYVHDSPKENDEGRLLYLNAGHAALAGFANSLKMEIPDLSLCALEISLDKGVGNATDILVDELFSGAFGTDTCIRYMGGKRQTKRIRRVTGNETAADKIEIKDGGVYIFTGGAGGLGLIIGRRLTETAKIKLVLVGRSPLPADRENSLQELTLSGSEVIYLQADISNREDMLGLHREVKNRYGRVDGIIHAAGALRDGLLREKTAADLEAVISPKVYGTLLLDEIFADEDLEFFALFSSTVAVTGNLGQTDYAFANHFLGDFVNAREILRMRKKRSGKTICYYWPLWSNGGMKANEQVSAWMKNVMGVQPLSNEKGIQAFERGLRITANNVIVVDGELARVERWFTNRTNTPRASRGGAGGSAEQTVTFIIGIIAKILKMNADEIKDDADLETYGMNSLSIAGLSREFEENGIIIPVTKVFELRTARNIADYIHQRGAPAYEGGTSQTKGYKLPELKAKEPYRAQQDKHEIQIIDIMSIHSKIEKFVGTLTNSRIPVQNRKNSVFDFLPGLMGNNNKLVKLLVDIGGGQKVEIATAGVGEPIVMIGGIGTTAPIWYYQLRDLSSSNRLIVIHMPGHGNSDMIDDLSLEKLGDICKKTLDKLGFLKPVPFVGLSVGGLIAQVMTINNPERVSSLVLIGTSYMVREGDYHAIDEITKKDFEGAAWGGSAKEKEKMINTFSELISKARGLELLEFLRYLELMGTQSIKDQVMRINVPTFIISGEKDQFFKPEDSLFLNQNIKNSKLWRLPDAGHFPTLTHYEEFNRNLLDFIRASQ